MSWPSVFISEGKRLIATLPAMGPKEAEGIKSSTNMFSRHGIQLPLGDTNNAGDVRPESNDLSLNYTKYSISHDSVNSAHRIINNP